MNRFRLNVHGRYLLPQGYRDLLIINFQFSDGSQHATVLWCASGCAVGCRICNREVVGSNLGLGYIAPKSTQPSIPPGSVNEYQLRLGRQRQVWLIPNADERVGVQVKLWNPLRTRRAIPERVCGGDSLRRGVISSVCTFYLYLYIGNTLRTVMTHGGGTTDTYPAQYNATFTRISPQNQIRS